MWAKCYLLINRLCTPKSERSQGRGNTHTSIGPCPHLSCIAIRSLTATPVSLKNSGHPSSPWVLYIRDIAILLTGHIAVMFFF